MRNLRRWFVLSGLVATACAEAGSASQQTPDASATTDASSETDSIAPNGPATIASGIQNTPHLMVADGTSVFWIDRDSFKLRSVPVAGGATTVLSSNVTTISFLAMDATSIYFLSNHDVHRVPKTGGVEENLTNDGEVLNAALGPNTLVWTRGLLGKSALMSVSVSGGPSVKLLELAGVPIGVAATSTNAFVTSGEVQAIPLAGLDGGAVSKIANVSQCMRIFADSDAAYCGLTRIANDGTVTVLSGISTTDMAVDATDIYFSSSGIQKISKQGGTPMFLATEPGDALAVDGSAVYWATSEGNIRRLLK